MISQKNVLKIKIRRDIFSYICNNPGLHLRELSRQLNIPKTTLVHHLNYLEKEKLIKIKNQNKYKRFFPKNTIGCREKEIIFLLRQKIPRNIIFYILSSGIGSQIELSRKLNKCPQTISYHLTKLKKLGILDTVSNKEEFKDKFGFFKRKIVGKEIVYKIKNRDVFDIICKILTVYNDSFSISHNANPCTYEIKEPITINANLKFFDDEVREIVDFEQNLFF